jgi:hypothetical protein
LRIIVVHRIDDSTSSHSAAPQRGRVFNGLLA